MQKFKAMQDEHVRIMHNYQVEIENITSKRQPVVETSSQAAFAEQLNALMKAIGQIETKLERNKRAKLIVDD